jgi:hypothetical protein
MTENQNPADVGGTVTLNPVPMMKVARITVEPQEGGDPVVLEPTGVNSEGRTIFRVVSGLPRDDVQGHGWHCC